jgi:hypothetical protein
VERDAEPLPDADPVGLDHHLEHRSELPHAARCILPDHAKARSPGPRLSGAGVPLKVSVPTQSTTIWRRACEPVHSGFRSSSFAKPDGAVRRVHTAVISRVSVVPWLSGGTAVARPRRAFALLGVCDLEARQSPYRPRRIPCRPAAFAWRFYETSIEGLHHGASCSHG